MSHTLFEDGDWTLEERDGPPTWGSSNRYWLRHWCAALEEDVAEGYYTYRYDESLARACDSCHKASPVPLQGMYKMMVYL